MATHTTTYQTDDLTGEQRDDIVTQHFAWGTEYYKIDLTPENLKKFETAMARFLKVAQPSTRIQFHAQPGMATNGTKVEGVTVADIRDWAKANGHTVNERGRLGEDIIAAYNAAHGSPENDDNDDSDNDESDVA